MEVHTRIEQVLLEISRDFIETHLACKCTYFLATLAPSLGGNFVSSQLRVNIYLRGVVEHCLTAQSTFSQCFSLLLRRFPAFMSDILYISKDVQFHRVFHIEFLSFTFRYVRQDSLTAVSSGTLDV